MAKKVGDPGSVVDHVMRLVVALRAGDWPTVFELVADIFSMVTNPMQCCAGPGVMLASNDTPEEMACKLEAFASTAKAAPVGAFDWKALLPLLLQILSMFMKQPAPAPSPAPWPNPTT